MRHPHAENMRLYAEDAAETDRPWERWEFWSQELDKWITCTLPPNWESKQCFYRRKPNMITITGPGGTYEYPEPAHEIKKGLYYMPIIDDGPGVYYSLYDSASDPVLMLKRINIGMIHYDIESARQHARALILAGGGSIYE